MPTAQGRRSIDRSRAFAVAGLMPPWRYCFPACRDQRSAGRDLPSFRARLGPRARAGEEGAQRRRCRLAWSRRARCRRRNGQERVDLREAAVPRNVLAPSNDAVAKGDARLAAHEFAHLEARSTLAVHEEPAPAPELRRAEILEPVLRA